MSGRTEMIVQAMGIYLGVIGISVVFMDLKWARIFNWFNLSVAVSGVLASAFLFGMRGILLSLAGIGLGLLLFGWMFALKFMGGGDVKYLMALGALQGPAFVLETAVLSILIGGAFAVALLMVQGKFVQFLKKIYYFIFSLLTPNLETQFPQPDNSLKMPFGIPISVASVWVYFGHPLQTLELIAWARNLGTF